MTPAKRAIEAIRALVKSGITVEGKKIDLDVDEAARYLVRAQRELCLRVMEEIGIWPSSEPELRALQKAWH